MTNAPEDTAHPLCHGLGGADPMVVPTLVLASELLASAGREVPGRQVGILTYGSVHSRTAAGKVLRGLKHRGRISPNDFVNANPGAPLSVVCTRLALRGPTLNLTMGGEVAVQVARTVARAWLAKGHAAAVILIEAAPDGSGQVAFDGTLMTAQGDVARRRGPHLHPPAEVGSPAPPLAEPSTDRI